MIPPRSTSPATQRWQQRVAGWFTKNLPLKVTSVFVAVVLWILVGAREPLENVAFVRFAPQLDSSMALRDLPVIRAHVIGRPSEILKLSNTPLTIRRPIANDAPDTLVLPLRTSDVEVPDGVEVIVRDVQPRELTLRFEHITSRSVPVRSAVRTFGLPPPPGVAVRLDPAFVTVRGPRSAVSRIRFVSTVPDSIAVDTLPHLVDVDTTGLGVAVQPMQVKVLFIRAPS
jgi:hypothetical protein